MEHNQQAMSPVEGIAEPLSEGIPVHVSKQSGVDRRGAPMGRRAAQVQTPGLAHALLDLARLSSRAETAPSEALRTAGLALFEHAMIRQDAPCGALLFLSRVYEPSISSPCAFQRKKRRIQIICLQGMSHEQVQAVLTTSSALQTDLEQVPASSSLMLVLTTPLEQRGDYWLYTLASANAPQVVSCHEQEDVHPGRR